MDFREDMDDKELVKAPTTINMAEQIAEANRDLSTHTTLKLNKKTNHLTPTFHKPSNQRLTIGGTFNSISRF